MTSPTEKRSWVFPAKAYAYAIDCMRAIQARKSIEGAETLPGWERQYSYHAFVKSLIERVDQEQQEAAARGDKGVGIMRSKSFNAAPSAEDDEGEVSSE